MLLVNMMRTRFKDLEVCDSVQKHFIKPESTKFFVILFCFLAAQGLGALLKQKGKPKKGAGKLSSGEKSAGSRKSKKKFDCIYSLIT